MSYPKNSCIVAVVFLFNLLAACSPTNANIPIATASPIVATPTKTEKPVSTLWPSATPNVIATQNYDDIFSDVQKYRDEGIISSTNGQYRGLDDYTTSIAKKGYLSYDYFGFTIKNFVYKAHVGWSTAGDTSDTSGCGIVFAIDEKKDNNNYYGVVLDKKRIFFSSTYGGYYYDMGKVRGTGKLDFGNPAQADLTLVIYDYKAFVYVDDEFIGEYVLSKDRALSGKFGFGIISGTNRDYGTRCEITNSRLWELYQ